MSAREWVRQWGVAGRTYENTVQGAQDTYVGWCAAVGRHPVSATALSGYLIERGLRKQRMLTATGRVWCYVGTLLEEEGDLGDGVGQVPDRASDRQSSAPLEVVGVEVSFEVGYCVLRVPDSLIGEVGRVLQMLAHAAEPTEQ